MLANIVRNAKKSVSGGDPYYSAVSLLLPMDGADGTTTFTDSSPNALTVTPTGDAKISTAQSKFGASGYFDGAGDYLSIPWNSSLALTGDFTVEAWICPTATPNGSAWIAEQYTGGTNTIAWCFGFVDSATAVTTGSKLFFGSYSGSAWSGVLASTGLTVNQWSHVAAVRIGSTLTIYLNGTAVGSGTFSAAISTGDGLYVGRRWDSYVASPFFQGYLDDIRVSRFARYTSAFTPPAAALPTYASSTPADPYYGQTSLLLHMDGANASTAFVDSGPNALAVTASGNAQISTAQSKFGGASGYFDGSAGTKISTPATSLDLGSGNFTVECWLYINASPSGNYAQIMGKQVYGSSAAWLLYLNSSRTLIFGWNNTGTTISSPSTLNLSTWYHVAVVRNGSTVAMYINGSSVVSSSISATLSDNTTSFTMGTASNDNAGARINMYCDDARISTFARYTSNFTPPAKAFPNLYNPYKTLPVSGAALWLDASQQNTLFTDAGVNAVTKSGDLVYQWNDLSGNNRHATQATSGNRPTWSPPASGQNGFGAVVFNGTSSFIEGSWQTFDPLSVYMVFKHTSGTSGSRVFTQSDSTNTDSTIVSGSTDWIPLAMNSGPAIVSYDTTMTAGVASVSLSSNTWLRIKHVKNDTSIVNTVTNTTASATVAAITRSMTKYTFGRVTNANGGYVGMQLAEVIAFNKVLTTGEEASMTSYLQAKWGVS